VSCFKIKFEKEKWGETDERSEMRKFPFCFGGDELDEAEEEEKRKL
jgi:hypothetical protein